MFSTHNKAQEIFEKLKSSPLARVFSPLKYLCSQYIINFKKYLRNGKNKGLKTLVGVMKNMKLFYEYILT
jgi:hypothetical protein